MSVLYWRVPYISNRNIFFKCSISLLIFNLEIQYFLHGKTEINMFVMGNEHFWSHIKDPRYLHLKKVYLFSGSPGVILLPFYFMAYIGK